MASGRVFSAREFWSLTKQSFQAWNDDYASSMGAALAYYTAFSLAPVLILVIAVAGLAFGADAARGEIVAQLRGLLGDQGPERPKSCWPAPANRAPAPWRRQSAS